MKPTLLLVHGAWHNGAGYRALQDELTKIGVNSETVELPSVAKADEPIGDMYQDAKVVREAASKYADGVYVLGHSYGGLSITEGLTGLSNVKGLIYLTAFMLDEGETLFAACGSQDPDWWIRKTDGERLNAGRPTEIFYNTCTPEVASAAAAQLRDQSLLAFNQPITKVAWKELPTTYIICEQDQAIPLFAQEAMSGRAKKVVRINTDHSPFLSAPKELAELIKDNLPV
jgi:pimeloyl-ACP methyl ester carboxylesterase